VCGFGVFKHRLLICGPPLHMKCPTGAAPVDCELQLLQPVTSMGNMQPLPLVSALKLKAGYT
jgi:hypothetical protein